MKFIILALFQSHVLAFNLRGMDETDTDIDGINGMNNQGKGKREQVLQNDSGNHSIKYYKLIGNLIF